VSHPHLIVAYDAETRARLAWMLVSEHVAHNKQRRRDAEARMVLPPSAENREIYYAVSAFPPKNCAGCDHQSADRDVAGRSSRSDGQPDPRQAPREAARARRWRYSR
jgi:hypothetical protein